MENLLANAWKYTSKHKTTRIPLTRFESAYDATYRSVREFPRDDAKKAGPG